MTILSSKIISQRILKGLEGMSHFNEIEKEFLFSWDDIPGNDNQRLIEFLKKKIGIDWVETAKIEKTDAGRTIKVATMKNSLSLRLNYEKSEVNLEIDDGKTDKFKMETKNGKLNIYRKEKDLSPEDKVNKFFENFEIEKQDIRNIAKNCQNISMDEKKLKSKNNELPILFNSIDFKGFRPANYDLRLGNEFFVSREKYPKRLSETDPYVVIEPGDFAILTTLEYIYVPDDLLGLISLRNSYKKYGLINISGFHVDPGYHGKLMFSVYNAGPEKVLLKYKEPVFMIMYDKLEEPALKGYEKEGFENITVDLVSGLIGHSVSPVRLKARIDSLEMQLRILMAIGIAVVVARIAKVI